MGNTHARNPTEPPHASELSAYEAACQADADLRSFDSNLRAQTSHAIEALAAGIGVRALSFDSLREVTGCLMEMNQDVVRVILDCKQDIWRTQELFELVEEYFENSLRTLDLLSTLDKCLKNARDRQLLVIIALQQFEREDCKAGGADKYARTLEELRNFKAAGDPFTEEFFRIFQAVYRNQVTMLEKLQLRKSRLDRKLKSIHAWRKVSSMIFAATFTAILICSVVAAAAAAPPLAAALAAAASAPVGSVGKWIDSLLKNYENAVKGQKDTVVSMQVAAGLVISDLENIRVLVDRLEIEIQSMLQNAEFAVEEGEVKMGVEQIKKKLSAFMANIDKLGLQADNCSRDIRRARTVVLQRIIKNPNQ
ncbi:hypothetical protein BT93_I1455 [Corymbia citriodora subsp. variegata]|nr:hypothetical protein BT93_I1455 [Corymbia citriodora subsp. variegata]